MRKRIMKRMIRLGLLLGLGPGCWGQEVPPQLIEQIAQYRAYLALVQKGYEIARVGLDRISDLKNGEYRLHKNHFDSLAIVKPTLRNAPMAQAIVGQARGTILLYWQLDGILSPVPYLSAAEKTHLKGVFDRLAWEAVDLLKRHEAVLTNGALRLSDDARIRILEQLHQATSANYRRARQVLESSRLLAAQRQGEQTETLNGRIWYGLH
ncbi:hypothetical protein GCM10027275_42900 [Rhabdobacter roseus]